MTERKTGGRGDAGTRGRGAMTSSPETEKGRSGDWETLIKRPPVSPFPRPHLSTPPRPHFSASPRPRVPASPFLRVFSCLLLTASCLLFASACRQDMQDQPKMKPFRATTFFSDGLSSRQPVEGTVARGFLRADSEFFTGKKSKTAAAPSTTVSTTPGSPSSASAFPDDLEVLPIPITQDVVTRGRERFEIFCSVCHGLTGNGDGMIVRRGFRRAASFHDDRLRQAPVGHFFDAITNGWGAMPSYAPQISVQDRWAIVAYIRALQLSQQNTGAPSSPFPTAQPTPASGVHQ